MPQKQDTNALLGELRGIRAELHQLTSVHAAVIERIAALKREQTAVRKAIQESIQEEYLATREKPKYAGIKVYLRNRAVYDLDEARSWAAANAPHAVRLDKRAFDRIIKALDRDAPEFVEWEEYAAPQIPSSFGIED